MAPFDTFLLLFIWSCARREALSFAPTLSKRPSWLSSSRQQRQPRHVPFVSLSEPSSDLPETLPLTPPDLEGRNCVSDEMFALPEHSHEGVNDILRSTEKTMRELHLYSQQLEQEKNAMATYADDKDSPANTIFANSYVDMSKVDVVGFDYDYTLVTYTEALLELIYDMALKRLVNDRQYPIEMLEEGLEFDPFFSIRGLAVDKETGWICHLSYTHKVSVAWEGREKLPTNRIYEEYRGKRALRPADRRKRLKPLNDLFSMAECCLIADTIQFFKDKGIPYCPMNVVTDVLSSIRETHISGDFHRLVAENPENYFVPAPHLKQVLDNLKDAGKNLIFVSNSPFWYVDAGMTYFMGPNWRDDWDAVIASAGKPRFYTDDARPFREVSRKTGRLKFKRVTRFERGEVYTEGCLKELIRLMRWSGDSGPSAVASDEVSSNLSPEMSGATSLSTSKVLYIGDSLFADLVDAKREFGWTTAAVTPEVSYELEMESRAEFVQTQRSIDLLLNALRMVQDELGATTRTAQDLAMLDEMENLVSMWRDRETDLLGNSFGSVFRARHQPSLFAHSLRRYCDLYMSSVSNLRHYSPQHRFYPEAGARLLGHEIQRDGSECWSLDDVMECVVDRD